MHTFWLQTEDGLVKCIAMDKAMEAMVRVSLKYRSKKGWQKEKLDSEIEQIEVEIIMMREIVCRMFTMR